MGSLDDWLPAYDFRERHERAVGAPPEQALAALLRTPVGSDPLVRALLRARGMRPAGPIEGFFAGHGFAVLQRSPTEVVIGTAGRPWRPRGRLVPFADAAPGMVRVATDLRAEPLPGGRSRLSTETRVAATDERSRRAFRRYWLLIRPWSGLVRRSWLRAAARSGGYPSAQT